MELGEKRLFISVAAGGLILLAAVAGLAWYLIAPRLGQFHAALPVIVGIAALLAALAIGVGLLMIALSALTGRKVLFSQRITNTVVRVLFPPVVMLARMIGVKRERVQRSFIAVNNALVEAGRENFRQGRVLLLLPHCLQATRCANRITGGLLENCRECGSCVIGDLLTMAKEHDVAVAVATGGTLARRVIGEVRPSAIVAVACETDLTTGIQDSYPLPVLGVLNERPNGPCRDTTVDLERVRRAINFLCEDER
jgi:uncharacterized protein